MTVLVGFEGWIRRASPTITIRLAEEDLTRAQVFAAVEAHKMKPVAVGQ